MRKILESPLFNVSLFSFLWALQIVVTKLAFQAGVSLGTFLLQESLVNLFVIFLLMLPQGKKNFAGVTKKVFLGLTLAGAVSVAGGGILSNFGIALTTAINAGFLVRFVMVTTILFAWLFLKERLTKSKIIALGIMLIGAYLVSTKGGMLVPHLGDFLIVGACVCWSIGTVFYKKYLKNHQIRPLTMSFVRLVGGLPILAFLMAATSILPWPAKNLFVVDLFNGQFFGYAFVVGIFDALNTVFAFRTLNLASASYLTMMSSITSVLVALIALIFLQETMIGVQILGGGLIVFAGVITYHLKIDKH